MKVINLMVIAIIIVFTSCNSGKTTKLQKMNFGIYETIEVKDVPRAIIDSLKKSNFQMEQNVQQPIIAYLSTTDKIDLGKFTTLPAFKLLKTVCKVDKEMKNTGIIAVKPNPAITNLDIESSQINGKWVEIYFNLEGAKKWAAFTKKNTGKMLAFVIDNQIYSLPFVNAEIKNGMAMMPYLENEEVFKEMTDNSK